MLKKRNQGENKILTISISFGISIVLIALFLIFVYIAGSEDEIYLSNSSEKKVENNTEKKVEEKISLGSLSFTADTYEIEIHEDVDMSKYLQCSGLTLKDVEWSSDSENIYVGSDGHVSINENGVTCSLTAVSKSDESIKTECLIKTRSEEEDLVYQVETLNDKNAQNEELENGVVRLAYNHENSQMIEVDTINYEPDVRDESYIWDSTLFYELEDIDTTSAKDGEIYSYFVEKKKFINGKTGNEMEYEIYRNPDTDKINKIVSIEYEDKKQAIVEYYYTDDEKVNFIYSYDDVNYIPSYATPNRDGESYLFSKDTMVTWRIIEEGKEVNYCVGAKEKKRIENGYHSNVMTYSECSEEEKKSYDKKEKLMLNLAYNTWDKITTEEGVSTISGYVHDSADKEIEDVIVELISEDYDCCLCTTTTDTNGFYEIMIPTKDMDYSIVFQKNGFLEEHVYEVESNVGEINLVQETVYLSELDEEEYSCELKFYDALNKSEDQHGMKTLDDLDIFIRRGVNNKSGKIEYEANVSKSSEQISLKPGMYTVQMIKAGYMDSYSSLFVSANTDNVLEMYATPELNEDEYRIVLTWNCKPEDLDSHLFAPSTDLSSDDDHICFYNMEDSIGNASLDVDDTDGYGPETTTIRHIQKGQYKFYVCDFTNCNNNNEESDEMSNSSATVRVYGKQGLIQTFNVPVKKKGVIWEVFEIRNGTIISNQRYYDSIGNRTWWQMDK